MGLIGKQVGNIIWYRGSSVCHQPWCFPWLEPSIVPLPCQLVCVCASVFIAFRNTASEGDTVTLVCSQKRKTNTPDNKNL